MNGTLFYIEWSIHVCHQELTKYSPHEFIFGQPSISISDVRLGHTLKEYKKRVELMNPIQKLATKNYISATMENYTMVNVPYPALSYICTKIYTSWKGHYKITDNYASLTGPYEPTQKIVCGWTFGPLRLPKNKYASDIKNTIEGNTEMEIDDTNQVRMNHTCNERKEPLEINYQLNEDDQVRSML
ncbi:hypothetical protein RF11_15587 [Thelohanellus kitauei]|uniref:Uncharacterized protein n=1 Tax=Thelohanellus kitauei TaxID=669202 RepID=A0A0C2N097_THEKT|nr:hypothetical protein RF11_15587 [Thelohanellus kitauei]